MRKYLFPLRLLLEFISILCLILSYQGLSYLNVGWYSIVIMVLLAEVMLTIYNILVKKVNVQENTILNSLGIGLYLYITILFIRLFFDQSMLYTPANLLMRFTFINEHLSIIFIGLAGYFCYHICTTLEK